MLSPSDMVIISACAAAIVSGLSMTAAHIWTILNCARWKDARYHAAWTALYAAVVTACVLVVIRTW